MSCNACNKIIQGQGIQAIGKTWHSECFVCDFCKQPFGSGNFIHKYDKPFCKLCDLKLFGNYCKGCNQPISGKSINALNSFWHPEHFVCSKCKIILNNGVYVEKNQKPFCKTCILSLP